MSELLAKLEELIMVLETHDESRLWQVDIMEGMKCTDLSKQNCSILSRSNPEIWEFFRHWNR